jgi:hypothetical protein
MSQEINEGHYLEVMDRLSIIIANLNDYVLSHPLVQSHPQLLEFVDQALENLADAYQLVPNLEEPEALESHEELYTVNYSGTIPNWTSSI